MYVYPSIHREIDTGYQTVSALGSENSQFGHCCWADWLRYIFRMEIDYSSKADMLSPRDRIVQRLSLQGVPMDYLEQLQPGLISFVKNNKFRVSEMVHAILPSNEDAVLPAAEAQSGSEKAVIHTLEDQFCESMVWLQWLMFEGDPGISLKKLAKMSVGQRGVCGSVWGNNDIAYRCRTCEHDPTCAICVPCFQNGNHQDHDYSVIYTGGGCCDCGDATAWRREGFCSKHKGVEQMQPLADEFANSVGPVLDSLLDCWKEKLLFADTASEANTRSDAHVDDLKKSADGLTSAVVETLLEFCMHSESLLSFVSGRVFSLVGLLDILVRAERLLSDDVAGKLHELLLKLLGEPVFKYEFAKVFLRYYPAVVSEGIKECNENACRKYPLLSAFSVQIFTVPTLTPRLVREHNLLAMLLECLGDIFISCAGEDGRLLINKWRNMYETTIRVVEDIRFVMSHAVVPRYVAHRRRDILRTWMRILTFVQGMNPQRRETGLHIEEENDHMHWPFVLCHSIANIHSLLVNGAFCVSNAEEADDETSFNTHEQDFYDQDSLRHAKVGRRSQESSVNSATGWSRTSDSAFNIAEVDSDVPLIPSSVSWVTFECLRTIESWFQVDDILGAFLNASSPKISNISGNNFFALKKTLSKIRKGKSLFKSYSAPLANGKITSSREVQFRQCSSSGRGGVHASVDIESGGNIGQDTSTSSFDDCSMEGEYSIEPEALRVLSLSDWPDIAYDVSSQDISVHIPLHRILSLLLKKALKKCFSEPTANSSDHLSTICCDFFGHFLGGCHPYGFSAFVMEHPLRIRVFCAEVHAGMWRKNGDAAILSCEWYRSVRWSEQGLELDLFLLQCCAALAPPDCYVKRILERFGLSDYVSLNLERGSEYEPILVQEMLTLIIQIVKERRFSGLTTAECLQRELIYKLAIGDATHSQLVKSLPRDLSKINQIQGVLDKIAVYSNPSGMNQGMYKLKRAYWKELDLYHPRWNSRDLQFAEERFLSFCSASALTTQLPKWTRIYYPLNGVARVATCKTTLQLVRAVLFYAVFSDMSTASRSPDGVVVTALHLLSLALDICSLQRESSDQYSTDLIPILAFSGEEICAGHINRTGDQSLLSLLVSLMKMRKEKADNFMEAGSFNLPSLIESVLKKFAEIDNGCMTKLQKLAPEVINDVSYSDPNGCKNIMQLASDGDMRKAKAKERQAAIMEKMRAQQSKFLASISSTANDGLEGSKLGQEASSSDVGLDSTESTEDICSLCHDSNSESPLSFLILLQKSRLLSLVDRGSPSWEQVHGLQEEHGNKSKMSVPVSGNTVSSSSGMISPSHLNQLIQNAVNEFAFNGQPREVKAFLEFIRVRFPSVRNIQPPCTSNDTREKPSYSLEMLEKQLYLSIRKRVHEKLSGSEVVKNDGNFPSYEGDHIMRSATTESLLLGKYIAALSKETMENPLTLENFRSRNDEALLESRIPLQTYDGFGPADCDGVHVSSCGHAVHQECLDCYLLSLKERHSRRLVFEGGHIVDPYKGEFLCPVCRGLANSVLPSLPGDSENIFTPSMFSTVSPSDAADSLMPSDKGIGFLRLHEALSLLQSAADVVGRGEILKAFPMQQNGKMKPKVESVVGVLCGMYFPGEQDKISGSARISHSMIMWDTLKYSLICTEIATRCGRTSLTPKYSLDDLYKELKSSSGFILSLLMKFARSTRIKNNLTVLLRLRGIQLFADSICSGVSLDDFPSRTSRGGDMLGILKNVETGVPYPDIQFWRRASDPVLSHDAFSSLMWVLFCLPSPILSCEDSFLSLVHIFYVVCIAQAIITYLGKRQFSASELGHHDCLITDLSLIIGNSGVARQYFISNYMDPSCDIKDMIRRLSFPYLRRCGLLWRLVNSSTSAPFSNGAQMLDGSSHPIDDIMECAGGFDAELVAVEQLEKMFKIPQLDDVLMDKVLRTLVLKWFHHLSKECNSAQSLQCVLHMTPAVPFKLMHLPLLYEDLLQRYIKQNCLYCGAVQIEPALCLLCGKLCTPNWIKCCCRENGCQTHAMACDAGIGVFLLIRKTTILLQRSVRQALWPSPYLDAFGEEDIEMNRGKPLYLNEERYAALTHMVASHGLDRSSKVLCQTTIGSIDF